MISTEIWIAIISSGGLALLAREIIPGVWKWATGRQSRERDLLQQAYRDLDDESRARRTAQEELHQLRSRIIQANRQDLLIPQHAPTPTSIIEPPTHSSTPPRRKP